MKMTPEEMRKFLFESVNRCLEVGNHAPLCILLDSIITWIDEQEQEKQRFSTLRLRRRDPKLQR